MAHSPGNAPAGQVAEPQDDEQAQAECAHPNVFDVPLGPDGAEARHRETGWECCDCGTRSWE